MRLLGGLPCFALLSLSLSLSPFIDATPLHALPWQALNVLSTTDIHGWLLGHMNSAEQAYSGDIGDMHAFRHHLDTIADSKGVDLLLVDSGDQVDGNGFVDADTSGYKGREARKLLQSLRYDVATIGNHELYNYTVAQDVYYNFVPSFSGGYLASNVKISLQVPFSRINSFPFGERYRKFVTKNQKKKVTSFGVLFNFDRPDLGLYVQDPKQMVEEEWFIDAVKEGETDVFLLVGHMATRDLDWLNVIRAIRQYHLETPILIFSGHAHVRDCIRPDANTQILASGRYLETLGFTSLSFSTELPSPISRRYLDNNIDTYLYHTDLTSRAQFDTDAGKALKEEMKYYYNQFGLDAVFGYAPQSYYLSRYPINHQNSLVNLYATKVINKVLFTSPGAEEKNVFMFNTGAVRFDLFKGPFTINDQFAIVPFENGMWSIRGLKYGLVKKVTHRLNNLPGEPELQDVEQESAGSRENEYNFQGIQTRTDEWGKIFSDSSQLSAARKKEVAQYREHLADSRLILQNSAQQHPLFREESEHLTYGYVTKDECGPFPADDTLHKPVPAFDIPDFVLSRPSSGHEHEAEAVVDLVFYEFITPLILRALNALQHQRHYSMQDVEIFSHLKANQLLGVYAQNYWN